MKLLYLEIVSLVVIIWCQFKAFLATKADIRKLEQLYPKQRLTDGNVLLVEYQGADVEQLQITDHRSDDFQEIVLATNSYLRNNKGSADFTIIKSISERVSEAQESQITSSVTTPLYLGLMGTFIGVILGLFHILFSGEQLLQTGVLEGAITGLLSGVSVAMLVSFFGLALTTYSNVIIFKGAVVVRDRNKNNYYNFLQSELLPNLDNNLYSALNLLKLNIGDFNAKFSNNLTLFDQQFGKNIETLRTAVADVSGQIVAIHENTRSQIDFLAELKQVDYQAIAKANIKMFDKMKDAAPMLTAFIEEHQSFNTHIHHTDAFVVKLGSLLDRVVTFEDSINGLGRDIQSSELLGSEVVNVVRKQLASIELKENLISEYASKSYSDIQSYLHDASERVQQLRRKIEIDFEHAFDFNSEGNLMQNLNYLKSIDSGITELKETLSQDKGTSKPNGAFQQELRETAMEEPKIKYHNNGTSADPVMVIEDQPATKPKKRRNIFKRLFRIKS